MAFVSIATQPKAYSINSSLLPVVLNMTEGSADTLNVVVQVYVWNGPAQTPPSTWVEVGGKMRAASRLDVAGSFYINIEDIINPYTDANLYSIYTLPNCPSRGSDDRYISSTHTDWEYIGNRLFRVAVQREYLDAATGLITLDPDTTTSNPFTGHEGVQQIDWNFKRMVGNWENFELTYDPLMADRKWLFILNNVPRYASRAGGEFAFLNEYRATMKEDEDFAYCAWLWTYVHPNVINARIRLLTYDKSDVLLTTRTFYIDGDRDAMQSFMCGPKSTFAYNLPSIAEGQNVGQEFINVAYYYIHCDAEKASGGGLYWDDIAAPFRINVDRTCKGMGYKRFMWRNQLGGWDAFTSDGIANESIMVARQEFQKRILATSGGGDDKWQLPNNLFAYGKNNWSNKTSKQGQVKSHSLTQREAKWFSMIGSSSQVYMKIMDKDSKINPTPLWNNIAEFEDWNECDFWIPIIIKSKSIKNTKSEDNYMKVEFNYEYAVDERWGRM